MKVGSAEMSEARGKEMENMENTKCRMRANSRENIEDRVCKLGTKAW